MLTKEKVEQAIKKAGNERKFYRIIKSKLKQFYNGRRPRVQTESINLIEIAIDELLAENHTKK